MYDTCYPIRAARSDTALPFSCFGYLVAILNSNPNIECTLMLEEKRTDFPSHKAEVVPLNFSCEFFMALQEVAPGDAYMQEKEDADPFWIEFFHAFSELRT